MGPACLPPARLGAYRKTRKHRMHHMHIIAISYPRGHASIGWRIKKGHQDTQAGVLNWGISPVCWGNIILEGSLRVQVAHSLRRMNPEPGPYSYIHPALLFPPIPVCWLVFPRKGKMEPPMEVRGSPSSRNSILKEVGIWLYVSNRASRHMTAHGLQ